MSLLYKHTDFAVNNLIGSLFLLYKLFYIQVLNKIHKIYILFKDISGI